MPDPASALRLSSAEGVSLVRIGFAGGFATDGGVVDGAEEDAAGGVGRLLSSTVLPGVPAGG
jgi:hypothetical protein